MEVTRKVDEKPNPNPNPKTKTWVVVLAFFSCVASFCFHAFSFWYQYYSTYGDATHGGARMDTFINLLSNYPIVAGGCALCVKAKSVFLTRRMNAQNLVGAYTPDEHGDLEKGVAGTDFHREAAVDVTMFSFACWVVGYPITHAIRRHVGWFEFMPAYYFKGFMACTFGTSSVMNARVLIHARRKMNKLKQVSCCT